jgi:hypothetical protein
MKLLIPLLGMVSRLRRVKNKVPVALQVRRLAFNCYIAKGAMSSTGITRKIRKIKVQAGMGNFFVFSYAKQLTPYTSRQLPVLFVILFTFVDAQAKIFHLKTNRTTTASAKVQDHNIGLRALPSITPDVVPDANGIVYVTESGAGKMDGSSWNDAYRGLANPLAAARRMSNIRQIWVAAGTYRPTRRADEPLNNNQSGANRDNAFVLVEGVKIYGGFDGTPTGTAPPDYGTAGRTGTSILSGNIGNNTRGVYHVVVGVKLTRATVLDGFTVTGGYSKSINEGSIGDIPRYYGGGISLWNNASPVLSNLIITGNTAYYGGGMCFDRSSPALVNVQITGNTAYGYGGGMSNYRSATILTNVTVAGNYSIYGSGGIYLAESNPKVRNSIIYGNSVDSTSGTTTANVNFHVAYIYANSLVEGETLNSGIISNSDPQFVAPDYATSVVSKTGGDYRLKSSSHAINMGESQYLADIPDIPVVNTDLAGEIRVKDDNIDLGAYEIPSILTPDDAGRLYVRRGGVGDGSSWANAYHDITVPLYLAKKYGVKEIWVAAGVYCPEFAPPGTGDDMLTNRDKTFFIVEGVKIYGGFTDTVSASPAGALPVFGSAGRDGESVLNGDTGLVNDDTDNVYHVVVAAGNMGEALLDGFTVTGGNSKNIRDISKTNFILIDNRELYRNKGAGINVNGKMKFVNLKITNNDAFMDGGGMYLNGNSGDSIITTNTVVAGNYAQYGGGIHANGGTCYLTNLTVTNNSGTINTGFYSAGSDVHLRNSIVWGNRVYFGASHVSGPVNHSHNLVQYGTVDGKKIVANNDPKFKDAFAGDYRLKTSSPAIDKGDSAFFDSGIQPGLHDITTDLGGYPRIFGRNIDVGAFEAQEIPIAAVNDTALTAVDMPAKITVLANDDRGSCSGIPLNVFKITVSEAPQHGSAGFADDTLVYTPTAGYFGVDSLDYSFGCKGDTVSARIYIMTVNPVAKRYHACAGNMVTMGFEKIPDVYYDWLDSDMTTVIKASSDTIKRVKDNSGNPQVFYARRFWKGIAFQLDTVKLFSAADTKPAVADIRVTLCPASAPRNIYLTGFLDSLDYALQVQWTTTGVFPAIHNASTGEIHPAEFPERGTFTYGYTRFSECATSPAAGKAYVNIATGKIPSRSDTVTICFDQAGAININSLFGLELGGSWLYDNVVSNNRVATSLGAIIFNGQKAYQQVKNNAAYDAIFHGIAGKGFVFEYDYSGSGCISGTKQIVVLVYTN